MVEPTNTDKADRVLWGRALKALRLRSGKTLQEAAGSIRRFGQKPSEPPRGISVQRWQQAEKGNYQFTDEQIGRLTLALGAKPEDLDVERSRILGRAPRQTEAPGPERETRGFLIPIFGRPELELDGWKIKHAEHSDSTFDVGDLLSPSIGVTHMADDLMRGWADAGAAIIFDRSRRPVEGAGCVLETVNGEFYPRIFVGIDSESVLLGTTTSAERVAIPRAQVKGVYAVRLRG